MKKLCTFVIFLLLHSWSFATLNAYFSYATFDQPGNSTYVESYLLSWIVSPNLSRILLTSKESYSIPVIIL